MRGKGIRAITIVVLLFVPIFLLLRPIPQSTNLSSAINAPDWPDMLEQHVKSRFPLSDFFGRLKLNLLLFSGQYEQNGVFISGSGLLRRIPQPDKPTVESNINTIIRFSDEARSWSRPVFVSLLPSAASVYRQDLPPFSSTVNQRQFISDTLVQLSGHATAIDMSAYLDSHRNQYIYYRTEDNFTSLGGFHISSQLLSRMLYIEPPTMNNYNLSYPVHDYFGDLYKISPYGEIEPDALTLFHYTAFNRQYTVTHSSVTTRKTYHTLFPEHLTALGHETDVFLGGLSAVTDITSSAPYSRRLLVFGDKSALAYAPFLANYYRQVTIVDLFDPDLAVSGISLANYTQVLFAYNAETLMTKELPEGILLDRIIPSEV